MIITIQRIEPVTLQIEFTNTEINHEMFQTVTNNIVEKPEINLQKTNITSLKEQGVFEKVVEGLKGIIDPNPEPELIIEPNIIVERELSENENPDQVIGNMVDEIREQYCGDVTPAPISVDENGKVILDEDGNFTYLEKDLSNCPQFKIGDVETTVISTGNVQSEVEGTGFENILDYEDEEGGG